jgi:hypothetical protein
MPSARRRRPRHSSGPSWTRATTSRRSAVTSGWPSTTLFDLGCEAGGRRSRGVHSARFRRVIRMFEITSERVEVDELRRGLMDSGCGGYTAFEGWVRDHHQGRAVSGLHYEAYESLAKAEGLKILAEAEERFGPVRLACVHRVGDLSVGELAVWVGRPRPASRRGLQGLPLRDRRAQAAPADLEERALHRGRIGLGGLRALPRRRPRQTRPRPRPRYAHGTRGGELTR